MTTDSAGAIRFLYTNYLGETRERVATLERTFFGANEWHPKPQWLVIGHDHEKGAERTFAARDMSITQERLAELERTPQQCELLASFQPEAWINDHATPIDGACSLDVTLGVLALRPDRIRSFTDTDADVGYLIECAAEFAGPFTVKLQERVAAFFGVDDQAAITDAVIQEKRLSFGLNPITGRPLKSLDAGSVKGKDAQALKEALRVMIARSARDIRSKSGEDALRTALAEVQSDLVAMFAMLEKCDE